MFSTDWLVLLKHFPRPVSRKLAAADKHSFQKKESVTALFPVCSGPKQFDAYLHGKRICYSNLLYMLIFNKIFSSKHYITLFVFLCLYFVILPLHVWTAKLYEVFV